jgi:hypothetical protein
LATTCDRQAADPAPRRKAFQPATVRLGTEELRAHVLDVSRTGAMFHCRAPLARDSLITIRCGETTVRGRIVWSEDGRHGIAFTHALPDRMVEAMIAG